MMEQQMTFDVQQQLFIPLFYTLLLHTHFYFVHKQRVQDF